MTMSKLEECNGDSLEPIKRLALVQVQPPRNPTKPLTSFNIEDILGVSDDNDNQPIHHDDKLLLHANTKQNGKSNKISSPDQQEITHCVKDISRKYHHSKDISKNNGNDEDHLKKRRSNDSLNLFSLSHHNKSSRDKEDFRASMPNLNPSLFSPPYGCFPKTLLQGFVSPFNINHGHLNQHLNPPHRPHPHHPSHHPPHHHHHHHHHTSPLPPQHRPVNLSTTNTTNNNNNNNSKIIRPWDNSRQETTPSPASKTPPSSLPTSTTTGSDDSFDEEDEEISVDDDEPPTSGHQGKKVKGDSVSPLDALMAMTSKTFAGLDSTGGSDPKRRDQTVLFGKHQPPKKRRKSRTAFTNQQIYELEKRFLYQKYLTPADRDEIAINLGLTNAQVITWFQNRRAKLKRDLEELKNDVTASKKLPLSRNMTGSVAEIELRRIQERTLRESFTNGGIQSPSSCSVASLSDDHDVATPIHSPNKSEPDRIIVDVMTSEPMDTDSSHVESNNRADVNNFNHRNSTENLDNNDNDNSSASLSPRESRENGSVVSECVGGCVIDNQKTSNFPVQSPGLV